MLNGRIGRRRKDREHGHHNYAKPITGVKGLYLAVIGRMIRDALNKPQGHKLSAQAWLFSSFNADSRFAVCDLAGVDPEFFENCLPRIRGIIEHFEIHDEYENMKAKEVAKYIAKMFMRHARDETIWQEVVE